MMSAISGTVDSVVGLFLRMASMPAGSLALGLGEAADFAKRLVDHGGGVLGSCGSERFPTSG
ncbi:hypothetical protein ACWDBC_26705 [Streptomyces parvus]